MTARTRASLGSQLPSPTSVASGWARPSTSTAMWSPFHVTDDEADHPPSVPDRPCLLCGLFGCATLFRASTPSVVQEHRSRRRVAGRGTPVGRSAGGYAGGVAWREEHGRGSILEVVNPDDDTSAAAVAAWIAALEQDDDWIDLPVTAAELVGEDRATRES